MEFFYILTSIYIRRDTMNFFKELWLLLSGFGIMFAILSWIQESSVLFPETSVTKGIVALITGSILYLVVAKKIN